MGPDNALRAVRMLRPRTVIPMHYDTWDRIVQDVGAFQREVEEKTLSRCLVMKPGTTHRD